MNIKRELKNFKKRLDRELMAFFEEEKKKAEKVDKTAAWLVERLAEFTLRGGKRLRPAFLFWGYKACGGKEEKELRKICLAAELTESWILILDDLMDKDKVRRGGPTVHVLFEKEAKKLGIIDRKHFGMVGAILVSLLGMQMVDRLIIESAFEEGKRLLVLNKLKGALTGTFFGQMMDVVESKRSKNFSEKMIKKIAEYKTAKYTVELPLVLGGILAGKKERELKFFEKYGKHLGGAFQIKDDILGVFGEIGRTGKSVLSDMREGKRTLLALKTLKELRIKNDELRINKFKKIWGKKEVGMKELGWVRKTMEEVGGLGYAKKRAKGLAFLATETVRKEKSLKREGKEFLVAVADFVVEREF
jgi:geranylgeranyl diphosphate synthase type I